MRVVSVSGTRGSGKTTLIRQLVAHFGQAGKQMAVIVNEEGRASFDEDFIRAHGITVKYIRGGWVGCSLASSLVDLKKKLKRDIDPDLLFIEPSEMVVTRELRDVAAMGLRDMTYEAGPFITLLDGPQFGFLWAERRTLLQGQVQGADLVAVSRSDLIGEDDLASINDSLRGICQAPMPLSSHNGANVEKVGHLIG